jgi:hypothetical protein
MPLTTQLPNAVKEFFAVPQSDYINGKVLAAGAAETIAVPDGAKWVLFASTADFFAKIGGTAAVVSDSDSGDASELNPTMRYLGGATAIGVISESDCKLTAAFYK